MNIVTAPLALLFQPSGSILSNLAPAGPPGADSIANLYFKVATLITLIMIGAGIYLLVAGTPGNLVIKGKEYSISTDTAGVALSVLGLGFYLLIGKLILAKAK